MVVGLFKVSLSTDLSSAVITAREYDRRAFKVMTYNVRGFYGENGPAAWETCCS
ncbi:MAG: hypothetical protein ACLRM8_08345 [Alistipes sp.]